MAYDWTQLTKEKITSYFLYGTDTPPGDLTSESLIRSPVPPAPQNGFPQGPVKLELDAVTFMTTGPGRFSLPGVNSALVAGFMDPEGEIQADGTLRKYTLAQMISKRSPDAMKWNPGERRSWISRCCIQATKSTREQASGAHGARGRGLELSGWHATTRALLVWPRPRPRPVASLPGSPRLATGLGPGLPGRGKAWPAAAALLSESPHRRHLCPATWRRDHP